MKPKKELAGVVSLAGVETWLGAAAWLDAGGVVAGLSAATCSFAASFVFAGSETCLTGSEEASVLDLIAKDGFSSEEDFEVSASCPSEIASS